MNYDGKPADYISRRQLIVGGSAGLGLVLLGSCKPLEQRIEEPQTSVVSDEQAYKSL